MGLQEVHYRALPRLFRRRRLLILGCGDVGQRLAALVRSNWRVFGIGRSEATLAKIRASGAVPLKADSAHRRLQDLADWVVHSAPPPLDADMPDGGAIDRLTRSWTTRLLGPTRRRRVVYLSTTGVYGDRQGLPTDETCTVRPLTARARRRVDAERRLRDAGRSPGGLQVTTLRVPGIYAADRLPIKRLQERLPALLPQDDVQTNHIHADDLARLTRRALIRGLGQRTINVVDDSALAMGDYLDLVARWAALPPPPRVDRKTLLSMVSPMRATFMSESRRLSNQRMKRELRLALRFPTVADFLAGHPPPADGGLPGRPSAARVGAGHLPPPI
jgi:nucleoside-diphosphate-sugar epimerase